MKLVVLTGLSGAGKSDALNALEDLDYYCIDNMPPALIGEFLNMAINSTDTGGKLDKLAICVDVRSREFLDDIEPALAKIRANGISSTIIFLEASNSVLIRRYNESRRQHPLSSSDNLLHSIERESEMLSNIRLHSDYIVDTSSMKPAVLKQSIKEIVVEDVDDVRFVVNISSFGYKYGLALDADIVMDTRFIPNPYYVKSLKELTGNSKKVSDYVLGHEITQDFLMIYMEMLEELIPCYMREGKFHLNIACGCTGGHHRSVAVANELANRFKQKGYHVTLSHRDL